MVLGFCQVMVLLAIAVALATRLPMIVNVNSCLVGLLPGQPDAGAGSQVSQNSYAMVRFMAQLFDTLLPGLEFFNLGPAIVRDTPAARWPVLRLYRVGGPVRRAVHLHCPSGRADSVRGSRFGLTCGPAGPVFAAVLRFPGAKPVDFVKIA